MFIIIIYNVDKKLCDIVDCGRGMEIQIRFIEGFSPIVGMHYAIGLHLARIF